MSLSARDLELRAPIPAGGPDEQDLVEVATWTAAELEEALREAPAPRPEQLLGWEFHGYNVADYTALLGIRKFLKGFLEPEEDGEVIALGHNVRVRGRGGPLDPWEIVRRPDGEPLRHGFFDVRAPRAPDDLYPQALLLDYDCGRNPAWDPSARIRDYLVALGPDLLLGKAYLAFGRRRLPVGFFVLERAWELELEV
ncbi:MAG: hypothetical protein AB7N76_25125 [Planctomycetota bacterium]